MSEGSLNASGGPVAVARHLVDAAASNRHECKLGGNEEGVEADQQEHNTKARRNRSACDLLGRSVLKGQKVHIS